jgi:DNA-binding phage protein
MKRKGWAEPYKSFVKDLQTKPKWFSCGNKMLIAERLFQLKEKLRMSYAEIARTLGISRQAVHTYFTADENLTIDTISKLLFAMGYEIQNISFKKIKLEE